MRGFLISFFHLPISLLETLSYLHSFVRPFVCLYFVYLFFFLHLLSRLPSFTSFCATPPRPSIPRPSFYFPILPSPS